MSHWWEIAAADHVAVIRPRAVAYYRHSAQDRQENSIPIQREKVRSWAEQNGIDIIKEFEDAGKSGLNAEGRPAFTEMMEEWVKKRNDFAYVICLDVSRWGRFQDIDLSAQYSGECKRNGKPVIYTTIGKPRDDDTFHPIHLHLERYRAAEYSRELSRKVWDGCVKISQQGYWAGGPPPYGLHRLLLDERREPLHPLQPGQRKSIQNQRVTLVIGDPEEVAVVRRIFYEFVELRYSEFLIAERLNAEKIRPGKGRHWTAGMVVHRLRNEKYRGTIVYNRTSRKLKTPCRPNPPDQWIRTPEAFEGIIAPEQFDRAQNIFCERRRKYEPETMLAQLEVLHKQFGLLHPSLIRLLDDAPSPATFSQRFGGMARAVQQLYRKHRDQVREAVHEEIRKHVGEVLPYSDFLVLDQRLTVSVQPAVPIPSGYATYWPFRPDTRPVIDITLGVLLSEPSEFEILGYVALPRWLAGSRPIKIGAASSRAEMFGRANLDFLQQLL